MLASDGVLKRISIFYDSVIDSYVNLNVDLRDTSQVEKWQFNFNTNKHKTLYIKQYRKDYYSKWNEVCTTEFEYAKRYESTFSNVNGFDVVVPILVFPEEGILISEEVIGNDLYALTLSSYNRLFEKQSLQKAYFSSGQGLKIFHQESQCLKYFDFNEFKDYTGIRISKLLELSPDLFNTNDANKINAFIDSVGAKVKSVPVLSSWLHGDYIPPNLIYNNDSVYLLDFLQLREGAILDEICYFLVFCQVQNPFLEKGFWHVIAKEFIDGYDLHINESEKCYAQLFYIKHFINYLLRTSYWFNTSETNSLKKKWNKIKYRYLKKDLMKQCEGVFPEFLQLVEKNSTPNK